MWFNFPARPESGQEHLKVQLHTHFQVRHLVNGDRGPLREMPGLRPTIQGMDREVKGSTTHFVPSAP